MRKILYIVFRADPQGAVFIKNLLSRCLPRTSTLFLHVQGVLELGAGVPGLKAFLVDGVVRVEANHQRIPCRVDFFQWLREGERKTGHFKPQDCGWSLK